MFFEPEHLLALPSPDHLRQLPMDVTSKLALIIVSELPAMSHVLQAELETAMDSRRVHDWTRVADSLRHYTGRPGLAREIEDAISDD